MHMGGGEKVSRGVWNSRHTADGVPTFTLYSSPSFDALRTDIGQPDGPSKLCLGCHDGSYTGSGAFAGGAGVFGINDLANSHPVSFTYDSGLARRAPRGSLRDPASTPSGLGGTIASDLLDSNGKLQCTSCHDVHIRGGSGKLLRYRYGGNGGGGDALCRVCHNR